MTGAGVVPSYPLGTTRSYSRVDPPETSWRRSVPGAVVSPLAQPVRLTVVGGAKMSDEDAYKIAKVLHDSQDKLAAIAKPFGRYNKAQLGRNRGVPFHPGAIKFYSEKGIWPPKS